MLHTLYLLFIAPLEFLMRLVLEWGFSWTHSWGWSLVLLSLVVNTAILPIYNWAERRQEEERALRRKMARHEAMLRRAFRGQKRFALLSVLRRQFGYGYGFTVGASVGLLLQIPFFFAAYHLLSGFTPLHGRSFVLLSDLGAPDGLLSLGGFRVNVLPIAMTGINLFSAFFYTRNLTRRDQGQIYVMALVFLVLLYNAASALTLYWTLNNVYSLCKNIVEKDWMRRPAWGRFGAACRCAMPLLNVRRGAHESFWTRLHEALRCSFITGAAFWIYPGVPAFAQRHNLLDVEFKTALRDLAGQCILTALLASLVLVVLAPSVFRHRPVPRQLVLTASVGVLFLLQFEWFRGGFGVEQGRFSFVMGDGNGGFLFVLWMLGVFGIGKFHDKLAGALAGLRNALLDWLSLPSAGSGREPEKTPVPATRDTVILACLMGSACGLFLWFFVPFCTYFPNVNEFDFNGWDLLLKVTPWCLLTIIISSSLCWASILILPCEVVRLPWRRGAGTCAQATILHSIALTVLCVLWLEGTILSYGLPQLDGETNLFNSRPRMIVDCIILIDLLLLGVYFWRAIIKRFFVIFLGIALISSASLLDMHRGAETKVDSRKFNSVKGLQIVSKNTLYSQIRFSKKHNIIILLVDSLDTPTFEKTIEIYPELKKIFDGFWIFRDNLGPGGLTKIALPQILSGETYEGEKYFELVQNSLVGKNSIGSNAVMHGYKIFIDSGFWCVKSFDSEHKKDVSEQYIIQLNEVLPLFVFRFLPYYGKSIFENYVNLKNHENSLIEGNDNNKIVFNKVLSKVKETIDDPVLQFLYFFGVHQPLIKENLIETTKEFIYDFKKFIDILDVNDLYNKSTIIIMADHGSGNNRNVLNPVFMVKTPTSTDNLRIQEDLMSSLYLNNLLKYFYNYGFNNETMKKFLTTLPSVRFIYKYGMGKMEARGRIDSLSLTKIAHIPLQDNIVYSLSPDNLKFPYAFPVATSEENANQSLGHSDLVNIHFSKINMSFLYNGEPGAKKRLSFMIDSWKNNGSIDIYDRVSGKKVHWEKDGQIDLECTVDDKGYFNVKFVPLTRQSSTIRYLAVSDESSPVPKLPRFRKESSHDDWMPRF